MSNHYSEGYIKFQCIQKELNVNIDQNLLQSLNENRTKLQKQHLIGMYQDGIGYGNISMRHGKGNHFYITGSSTGNLSMLLRKHIALVTSYSIELNIVNCSGITKASSESMTHAAIYESLNNVNAVVHIHSKELWDQYIDKLPTTDRHVEYGTPEMALELKEEIKKNGNKESAIIVMGGHPEGIISYAKNINTATEEILKLLTL